MRQIAVRDEKWDLTEDETEDFSRLGKDLDALDARISEVDGQESGARQSDNAFSNVLGQPVDRAVPGSRSSQTGGSTPSRRMRFRGASNAFVPTAQADVWYDRLRSARRFCGLLRTAGGLSIS